MRRMADVVEKKDDTALAGRSVHVVPLEARLLAHCSYLGWGGLGRYTMCFIVVGKMGSGGGLLCGLALLDEEECPTSGE